MIFHNISDFSKLKIYPSVIVKLVAKYPYILSFDEKAILDYDNKITSKIFEVR